MAVIDSNAHWRNSARPIRFFFLDGQAVFPLLFFLLHITWWSFAIASTASVFFCILNRYGFSPIVFARWLRGLLAGGYKTATPWWIK